MPKPTAPHDVTPVAPDHSSPPAATRQRIADLYRATECSGYVFGSPLDSLIIDGRTYELPRFVYFGKSWNDVAIRLAMYAGFDGRDARTTGALLGLVETLTKQPHLGEGLNVHVFPLINPTGLELATRSNSSGHELLHASWAASAAPELQALGRDIRQHGYQGFITLETADLNGVEATLRFGSHLPASAETRPTLADTLLPSLPLRPAASSIAETGPLTLVPDLAWSAFELRLRLPASWSSDRMTEVVGQFVTDFIPRYRAHVCYGLHL